jgi:uncharacterized protein
MFRRRPLLSVLTIAAAGLVIYLAVAGAVLHRFATRIMTVGPLAATLAEGPRPTDPRVLGYRGDPAQAFGYAFETLSLPTGLGPAEAWFVPAGTGARAAIYVHGVAGTRENGYRHLPLLHDLGIPVLLISYRNDETAPAAPEGRYAFGLTEWPDLAVAVAAMQARGHTDLILVGESMGGAIVGQFLRNSPDAASIVAVALDAPAVDFRAVLRHIADQMGLPLPGIVARIAETSISLTGPVDVRNAQVTGSFATFDGPLFIAHGRADRIVPASGTAALIAARDAVTISLHTSGDHLQSYAANPEGYRAAFTAFASLIR